MASILYKWLIGFVLTTGNQHPVFVSVTEIAYSASNRKMEVSCKVFTDDFETALRKKYNTRVDLHDTKLKPVMKPLVNEYIQKHLSVITDRKIVNLQFLGFEQQEEGIISFYEAKNINSVKKLEVVNDIFYENKPEQMGIIRVMVNGQRKTSQLNNPDARASFEF